MRDQGDHPLDRATYWIEYVIRHNGAHHLRTASRKLSLIQKRTCGCYICLPIIIHNAGFRTRLSVYSNHSACIQITETQLRKEKQMTNICASDSIYDKWGK